MKFKRGHAEDFFADFIVSIPIIIIGIIILSFYTGQDEVRDANKKIDDILGKEAILVNFLSSPVDSGKLEKLSGVDYFENMDVADVIILESQKKESLDNLYLLDEYFGKIGEGYDVIKVRYPDGTVLTKKRVDIEDLTVVADIADYVVYLPSVDGGKIEVELIML